MEWEAVQISSLKGGLDLSEGFNPGFRQFSAMCPEGAIRCPTSERNHLARLFILAPLSGLIFVRRVPRVETLG
jgi:hypothetical protein